MADRSGIFCYICTEIDAHIDALWCPCATNALIFKPLTRAQRVSSK